LACLIRQGPFWGLGKIKTDKGLSYDKGVRQGETREEQKEPIVAAQPCLDIEQEA
jgi:hypothetical protein